MSKRFAGYSLALAMLVPLLGGCSCKSESAMPPTLQFVYCGTDAHRVPFLYSLGDRTTPRGRSRAFMGDYLPTLFYMDKTAGTVQGARDIGKHGKLKEEDCVCRHPQLLRLPLIKTSLLGTNAVRAAREDIRLQAIRAEAHFLYLPVATWVRNREAKPHPPESKKDDGPLCYVERSGFPFLWQYTRRVRPAEQRRPVPGDFLPTLLYLEKTPNTVENAKIAYDWDVPLKKDKTQLGTWQLLRIPVLGSSLIGRSAYSKGAYGANREKNEKNAKNEKDEMKSRFNFLFLYF